MAVARWRRGALTSALIIPSVLGLALGSAGEPQAQSAAGPTFSRTGPSAAAYGEAQGYPLPDKGQPMLGLPQEFLVGLHSRYDRVRPVRAVPTSATPSPLKRATRPIQPIYAYDSRIKTINDYLAEQPATGLLIAREDTILFEHYQYARTDRDRFTSWSMAKTVLGMLVGIAVSEGAIKSIDESAATYVPELAGTEYGATSIRAFLQMSSGVAFSETYQPGDDISELGKAIFSADGPGSLAAVRQFNRRAAPPGTHFNYSSADSVVLGLVLRRAVGVPLAEYLSTRIWQKLGAEADAGWDVDSSGQEIAFCCIVATLRDWARFALMLANDGAWNGQQIVPRQWILDATTVAPGSHLAASGPTRPNGYGYQVWVAAGDRRRFNLMGIRGQFITVDPVARLVIVHTAVRTNAGFGPANIEFSGLLLAIIAQYALK